MPPAPLPKALVERLGHDGAQGLATWVASEREALTDDVMELTLERFDRRLTTELSALRVDVARELAALRVDAGRDISTQRGDVARDLSAFRGDVARELSAARSELLKWSFACWIGQVAATAGLLAYMLRP
jgi:hypothetical protein